MKPFNYEIATQKLRKALDEHGLTLEEKREVLIELLKKEDGLKNVNADGLARITEAALQGNSVMFLDGSNVSKEKLTQLTNDGKVDVTNTEGKKLLGLAALENFTHKGYATIIQHDSDLTSLTTVGRARLSPESAAMMVHHHQGGVVQSSKAYGGGSTQELAESVREGLADAALDQKTVEAMADPSIANDPGVVKARNEFTAAVTRGKKLLSKFSGDWPVERALAEDRESYTPGAQFAIDSQKAFTKFVQDQKFKGNRDSPEARKEIAKFVNELADDYGANEAQVRYISEMYDLGMRNLTKDTKDDWAVCQAWAAAAEVIPDIHDRIAEFERRIGVIYWPPTVDSAATAEATLMAISYSWSALHAKNMEEWLAVQHGDVVGNLLGVLAANGHSKIALFVNKLEPLREVVDLCEFGLDWLDSNFSKLEIGHKLAASLCLTDVPDDLEVKAPWVAWSFVIPDGLLLGMPNSKGELEDFARVLCRGAQIKYLVSSKGRCVGPVNPDQSGAPEGVIHLFKLLNSLVKGACLALSDPDQYKKKSIGGNEGSFKSKRAGGAPVLNNARFMLSAAVQVDLRDVVHAVQRGERRKGGKLTVQFLVRGHWKNQAHGPHQSLRKRIWLQPFWKGNEETRILLRNYVIKDKEEGGKDGQGDV